jgi:hypothetical protein
VRIGVGKACLFDPGSLFAHLIFFQATLVLDNQTTSDDDRALWTRKNGKQWRAKPWGAAQCPSLGEQEGLWPTV